MRDRIIRSYNIGQVIRFDHGKNVKIIDYADTITCHTVGNTFEVQLYKVLYNNEEYYASNFGLDTKDIDIFKKVINGIGYRGKIDFYKFKKEYKTWKDMIYRCYNQNSSLFPYYGAIGVTVCPKWLCFEMFLYDLINVEGYESFANPNNKRFYELDIDSKQSKVPSNYRYYGPGVVSLKLFYSSDVGINVNRIKERSNNMNTNNKVPYPVPLNPDLSMQRYFTPLVGGNYSIDDYKYVINNYSNFASINDDPIFSDTVYRTLHGVVYKANPITEPYVPKKVMCVKI